MGQCIYCKEAAGFLRRSHKECRNRRRQGELEIISRVGKAGLQNRNLDDLEAKIKRVAKESYVDTPALGEILTMGWERAVEGAFADGILSLEEEESLSNLMNHFSLSQSELDRNGCFMKVIKGAMLRDILSGNIPENIRFNFEGDIPFNLQKTEKIVWIFQDVDYYQEKTRTHYVGGSQGFSVRIAKGVYYRTGRFKGRKVQTSETVHEDQGLLGVTNKHIYFVGASKRFRIAYNKIVAFESFSDGIGVQRDAQTAKPQSFSTGDGWFTYNLIRNLAQL